MWIGNVESKYEEPYVEEICELLRSKNEEKYSWSNLENNKFYEELNTDGLKKFAEIAGLNSCCDLKNITQYLFESQSILEVGTGYGRVIDYLLENNYAGNITAIEQCKILFDSLKNKFFKNKNIELVNKNILDFKHEKKFDLILMLWSGIADFSPKEQVLIVKKLARMICDNGILIIDTFSMNNIPLKTTQLSKQLFVIKLKQSSKYIYEPSVEQIESYAEQAHALVVKKIKFNTDTNRQRWLHIIKF